MPFNVLILPLLGGYIFVRFWHHTKIHIMRSDKDRLLIRASIIGLFTLMFAYAAHLFFAWLFPCSSYEICVSQLWREKIPFEFSDISFTAFLFGAFGWIPLNLFYSEQEEIDRAIREDADPFELLLKRSQDETIAILITMTNHKVYICHVTHQFNPVTPTSYIGLFPLKSGYRDPVTKELHITLNYSKIYSQIGEELDSISQQIDELEKMSPEKQTDLLESGNQDYYQLVAQWEELAITVGLFELVIPTNQISSIFFFDDEVHGKYFAEKI